MSIEKIKKLKVEAGNIATTYSDKKILEIVNAGNTDLLIFLPIALASLREGQEFVEYICIKLSKHSNYTVRGNAILSFGYLAARFEKILNKEIFDLVKYALKDSNEYVRNQAQSATDDLDDFLEEEKERKERVRS